MIKMDDISRTLVLGASFLAGFGVGWWVSKKQHADDSARFTLADLAQEAAEDFLEEAQPVEEPQLRLVAS